MAGQMTFGRKLHLGFAVNVAITLLISGVAVYALQLVVNVWEHVIVVNADSVANARQLEVSSLRRISANRGYMLTKEPVFRAEIAKERASSEALIKELRSQISSTEETDLLEKVEKASTEQANSAEALMVLKEGADASYDVVSKRFMEEVIPKNLVFQASVEAFVKLEDKLLETAKIEAARTATFSKWLLIAMAAVGTVIAAILGYSLSRSLSRQIGSAVQHIQSSSAELQSAANQQTAGSKEQVASMTEISTTIKELTLTARQIAQSAQRVATIAQDTGKAATDGEGTVQKTQEGVAGIRRQVDVIVTHMLDLGRKSQQIGGILEIINELAEQTNILAINATIEAAGAGESGKRFAVVADEIRKLADRVGDSTREIRGLIDEIRSAVNTTVMATESGSKAVDLGVNQFSEVAGAFRRIAGLLDTTTEAAREIELSTKQQSTAVEQVNIAVASVAQAAKEAEASSGQVLETVGELTGLSRELSALVRAGTAE